MRDSLRQIRQETRQTRSLETLRENFEQLQSIRRQSLDDFDLQVMIGDIHQEIIDRARYLRGESPAPSPAHEDHSVIFQARISPAKTVEPAAPIPAAPIEPAPARPLETAAVPEPPAAPAPPMAVSVAPPSGVTRRIASAGPPPRTRLKFPPKWPGSIPRAGRRL